jgi:carboxymethylenebutenolidase
MSKEDLVAVWEEHLRLEFAARTLTGLMETMVEDPTVNHVPTMTGGVGRAELSRFYKYHFIDVNPPDFETVLVSRTVGESSLVDELIVRFTHSRPMDYLAPGVAPTGRRVELPVVAVARFRDGKLASENIYWDQATVLVQLGLLDPAGLPAAGAETAAKVLDATLPSNRMMAQAWATSEGRPV